MVDQKTSIPPPYAPETRAKGWRLELDHERIRQSDTWALASPELRPWLLMLWMVAWEQTPCASLPDNDQLIAARIGMSLDALQAAKGVLLRGWWRADDGRLYHRVMTELVLDMLARKERDRARQANYRACKRENVARDAQGTNIGRQRDSRVTQHGVTAPEPEPEPVTNNTCADEPHVDEPIGFADCWAIYPKREGGNPRKAAMKSYKARLNQGVTPAELIDGTRRYAAFILAKGQVGTSYVKLAATFYGPDEHWREPWAVAKQVSVWDTELSWMEGLL